MTIDELIDDIQGELTVGGAIPRLVPDTEIRRIVMRRGVPWFWRNYRLGSRKEYWLMEKESLKDSVDWSGSRKICIPHNVIAVTWMWEMNEKDLFSLGINAPNLSINLGVTNQPYLTSFVTNVGQLGVYKVALDFFSDMINKLSKYLYKFEFIDTMHELTLLGPRPKNSLILEVYAGVEEQYLFEDETFIRWCVAKAKIQQGRIMGTFDYSLPGGIKINGSSMSEEGKTELKEIEDLIYKSNGAGSFMIMAK